jgi:hypothetical protein
MSRNEKIVAAVTGVALAAGGKELWDGRDGGEHRRRSRDVLSTAAVGAAAAASSESHQPLRR